jgi:hypothetical protein
LTLLVYGLTRSEDSGFGSPVTLGALSLSSALVAAGVLAALLLVGGGQRVPARGA